MDIECGFASTVLDDPQSPFGRYMVCESRHKDCLSKANRNKGGRNAVQNATENDRPF